MLLSRMLHFFISSVASLPDERDAVNEALRDLHVEGLRFEECPSTPLKPMDLCLEGVQESDAVILLLGSAYGTVGACKESPPRTRSTATRSRSGGRFSRSFSTGIDDLPQRAFIEEVEAGVFRCSRIRDTTRLKLEVRRAVLAEFACRWKQLAALPPGPPSLWQERGAREQLELSHDAKVATAQLRAFYDRGEDAQISAIATKAEDRFANQPAILDLVYQAEVNLGLANRSFDRARVERAISFWSSAIPADVQRRAGDATVLPTRSRWLGDTARPLRGTAKHSSCTRSLRVAGRTSAARFMIRASTAPRAMRTSVCSRSNAATSRR